tara:strand:+ start:128 stop:328 length:201 start_codon:yes stop_codon:yes gene_type:complete
MKKLENWKKILISSKVGKERLYPSLLPTPTAIAPIKIRIPNIEAKSIKISCSISNLAIQLKRFTLS